MVKNRPKVTKKRKKRRAELQALRREVGAGTYTRPLSTSKGRPRPKSLHQSSRGDVYAKMGDNSLRRVDPESVKGIKRTWLDRVVHAVRHTRSRKWRKDDG